MQTISIHPGLSAETSVQLSYSGRSPEQNRINRDESSFLKTLESEQKKYADRDSAGSPAASVPPERDVPDGDADTARAADARTAAEQNTSAKNSENTAPAENTAAASPESDTGRTAAELTHVAAALPDTDAAMQAEAGTGALATDDVQALAVAGNTAEPGIADTAGGVQAMMQSLAADSADLEEIDGGKIPGEKNKSTKKLSGSSKETGLADDGLLAAVMSGQTLSQSEVRASGHAGDVSGAEAETAAVGKGKSAKKADGKDPLITVRDERTDTAVFAPTEESLTATVRSAESGTAEMQMNLSGQSANGQPLIAGGDAMLQHTAGQPDASQFSSMLSQQLQADAGEFVKAGSLVLKDNNRGTINLILHPEALGNVKIQLELTDKVIAGKIIVGSEEAYNAFKANLPNLREAFTSGGFTDAGFDLTWAGNGSGSFDGGSDDTSQRHAQNMHGTRYADALGTVAAEPDADAHSAAGYYRNSYINIVA